MRGSDSSRAMFRCDRVHQVESELLWLRTGTVFHVALLDTLDKADASAAGESFTKKIKTNICRTPWMLVLKYQDRERYVVSGREFRRYGQKLPRNQVEILLWYMHF